jgi:hypothetical protein
MSHQKQNILRKKQIWNFWFAIPDEIVDDKDSYIAQKYNNI